MTGSPYESQPDLSPPAAHHGARRKKPRNRTTTACNACRARRTRCDSRKPACSYCRTRGFDCQYEQRLSNTTSRVEAELAAINQRLDHLTNLLPSSQAHSSNGDGGFLDHNQGSDVFTGQEKLPFQLLGTECMMSILGLEPDFAQKLLRLERETSFHGDRNTHRLHFIQQQQALSALASFSAYVHVWYPVLRPGFSDRYLSIISGSLPPGSESCLVLLVAAVGTLAHQEYALGSGNGDNTSESYLEAAMSSLPAVLTDSGIEGVQCLLLLSIYYCSLSKPCQAYDYVMIASFKVQNLLKNMDRSNGELYEHTKRAYWAILLLESEIRASFDLVGSGIWDHDDRIELPDSRRTWQFDADAGSPQSIATLSPESTMSVDNVHTDRTQSYFLAEISMRRMLHRCNTAIRRTPQGEIVYAPGIASELEHQLHEWYGYLPDAVRFPDLDFNLIASPHNLSSVDPLTNFLRVQYYCCKISVYWPAVYQCIQDGVATPEVLTHCERFFHAYIQLMPSMLMSIRDCIVNRWTLYATIFMTSMAVVLAAQTPCLRQGCVVDWSYLLACLQSTRTVDRRIVEASPSLSMFEGALVQRLIDADTLLGETQP